MQVRESLAEKKRVMISEMAPSASDVQKAVMKLKTFDEEEMVLSIESLAPVTTLVFQLRFFVTPTVCLHQR